MQTMMKMVVLGLASAAALGLAGCRSVAGDGFPDPERAYPRGGTFVNIDDLRQYAPGMNKDQVQALLGPPQFNEGMWGVREWNYLFNLRRSVGAEPVRCQFRIEFDSKGVAQNQHWKPEACSALLEPPAVAAPAAPPPPPPAPVRLQTDALFDFDSATLKPAGQERLRQLVREAGDLEAVRDVLVVGYTDRIGSDAYNLKLSQRRAQAVRDFLVGQGLPASAVRAEGRGEADPVAECPPGSSRAVIECLAPNRRVEITGITVPAKSS
ncbi:OmpA family protein [[Pseudomonas] boreopolis]|uniref:outer membrane protein assembly factor BamE n=1 Tax=Xanthomonas boreopolis TaxID=86183 RepID=UPI003D9B1B8F